MTIIRPFRAMRPVPEQAKRVSCVPYDVIEENEVRQYIHDNPFTFLKVTRPEASFPEGQHPSDGDACERGRQNLDWFINEHIFVTDAVPSLYVYRVESNGHSQTGVVACCSLDEYEQGLIKRHEKTRPEKVKERTKHLLSLGAQTGLIFLTFRGTDPIRDLIAEAVRGEPLYHFLFEDGSRQTLWHVTDPQPWIEAFEDVPALYIADGHHRVESANRARAELRERNPNHTGEEDYNYVLAGIFPAEDLQILPYNRVVKDLNGLTRDQFLERLGESFVVQKTDRKQPENHGEICMYLDGEWYLLRFAVDFIQDPGPVKRLDVSILQDYILSPILGIDDPRTDNRIKFVGGAKGANELENRVDDGSAEVAFSLYPTTMEDLFEVSDMGEIMPPKSTWFEPKLKDGLLIHLI